MLPSRNVMIATLWGGGSQANAFQFINRQCSFAVLFAFLFHVTFLSIVTTAINVWVPLS